MASRFDIATGKTPKPKPSELIKAARKKRFEHQVQDYSTEQSALSNLKIVNNLNGQEVHLNNNVSLNLSIDQLGAQPYTTINLTFTCPIDVAQRLLAR